MQTSDPLVARFSWLLESGMSKEEAWKVMAVEILADAGIIAPEHLAPIPGSTGSESGQTPVFEAKLVKVIRIDPAEDDRIRALLGQARREAALLKGDSPSMSSVIRQAIRLGLDELERERGRK